MIVNIAPLSHTDCSRLGGGFFSSKCFLSFSNEGKLPWNNTVDFCTARSGSLVAIHSSQENIIARSIVPSNETYWLGLSIPSTTWTDLTAFDYNGFASSPSNYTCAYMNYSSSSTAPTWSSVSCDAQLSYKIGCQFQVFKSMF